VKSTDEPQLTSQKTTRELELELELEKERSRRIWAEGKVSEAETLIRTLAALCGIDPDTGKVTRRGKQIHTTRGNDPYPYNNGDPWWQFW
jgi:hypothetical protein